MEFLESLEALSSTGIVDFFFTTLETAGKWATATNRLLGLL